MIGCKKDFMKEFKKSEIRHVERKVNEMSNCIKDVSISSGIILSARKLNRKNSEVLGSYYNPY